MLDNIISLVVVFGSLSLLAIGGGNTIIPDIHRETVVVHGWMTNMEFASAFAIARAAPGPGSLLVALIGWKVGGLVGSVFSTLAMYVPPGILMYITDKCWRRLENNHWQTVIERGLVPIAIGLIFASAWVITSELQPNTLSCIFIAVMTGILARTKINPLLVMMIAGFLGLVGVLQ